VRKKNETNKVEMLSRKTVRTVVLARENRAIGNHELERQLDRASQRLVTGKHGHETHEWEIGETKPKHKETNPAHVSIREKNDGFRSSSTKESPKNQSLGGAKPSALASQTDRGTPIPRACSVETRSETKSTESGGGEIKTRTKTSNCKPGAGWGKSKRNEISASGKIGKTNAGNQNQKIKLLHTKSPDLTTQSQIKKQEQFNTIPHFL
jgi:hypothetical protein